jgi:hypothetical protein
MDCLTASEKF